MTEDTNDRSAGFDPGAFVQLLQQAWQQALPGAAAMPPGMSVTDLEKRITELRVVEQWLDTNLTMLRTTVQALEVQRGTLAALQAFGDKLGEGNGSRPAGADREAGTEPMAAFSKAFQQMSDVSQASLMPWWQGLQQQFQAIAAQTAGPAFAGLTPSAGPGGPDTDDPAGESDGPAGKGRSSG